MRAAINGLGIKPAEFWALTPVELMIMLGRDGGSAPLGREGLDALTAAFPDIGESSDE